MCGARVHTMPTRAARSPHVVPVQDSTRQDKTDQTKVIAADKLWKTRFYREKSMTYPVEKPVDNRSGFGTTIRRCALVLLAVFAGACGDSYQTTIIPSTTAPSPTPDPAPAPTRDIVEFRVVGTVPLATVRIDNSLDGFSQTTSVLPYSSTLSISGRDSVFLSLDARSAFTGVTGSFLHAAIFVNGTVFRESSSDAFSPVVSVSGTWRRADQR